MPKIKVVVGLKSLHKTVSGVKSHKKGVVHSKATKTGGALKKLVHGEQQTGEFGSNLSKLRQSLKSMHITSKPARKRYVEL